MPVNDKFNRTATAAASVASVVAIVGATLLADSLGTRHKDGSLYMTIGAWGIYPALMLGLAVGHFFKLVGKRPLGRAEFLALTCLGLVLIYANAAYLVPAVDPQSSQSGSFLMISVLISWLCWSTMILLAGSAGRSSGITKDGSGQKTAK